MFDELVMVFMNFLLRVVMHSAVMWNRLPANLVQVHNLIKFKSMLRTVDLSFALLGKF